MEEKYYHTKESVIEYIKSAKDVNGQELIDKFELILSPNSSVLELGSGPGSDWEILNAIFNVTGSDNSNEFIQHLKSTFSNGQFLELDAVTLKVDSKFDGIYSNKVLHHLTDDGLKKSLKRQSEILNDEGVVCHSFWKGEGSEVFKGLFVNYHLDNELKTIFNEYFNVISLEFYDEFEKNDSILLIAKKK